MCVSEVAYVSKGPKSGSFLKMHEIVGLVFFKAGFDFFLFLLNIRYLIFKAKTVSGVRKLLLKN